LKINEEFLSIVPAHPKYAKDHMDLFRNYQGHLDQFLDIDEQIMQYTFKDHNAWILSYRNEAEDHPTFMIQYQKSMIGMIYFREAKFKGGVQVIYFVHKNFSGRGVITSCLEHLANIAFFTHKFLHIELHIDSDNIASQKVASKLGYEVIDEYNCVPIGKNGSGEMKILALTNSLSPAFWRQIPRDEWSKSQTWAAGRYSYIGKSQAQQLREIRKES
jgi:RimJ/RimL family protein N-acetyltransferase